MNEIYCSKCNSTTIEGNSFCPYCGQIFKSTPEMGNVNKQWPQDRIDNFLVTDMGYYVGSNREKYLKNFKKVSDKKFTFNWAACFATVYWILYRRMIIEAFIFIGMSIVFVVTLVIFELLVYNPGEQLNILIGIAVSLLIKFAFGAFAYPVYLNKVKRSLKMHDCENRPAVTDIIVIDTIKKAGGTRIINVIIYIVIKLIVFYLLYIIYLCISLIYGFIDFIKTHS